MGRRRASLRGIKVCMVLSILSLIGFVPWGAESRGEQDAGKTIVENRCSGCHPPRESDGKLDAIEFQRKTPEGWEMTIDRMRRVHGAQFQPNEARVLVKYLSDQYGLAPSEVKPFRYALEKRITTEEQEVPKALQGTCVQCHSYARIALQKRAPEQWERLPDLKAALMPNVETQTASAGVLQAPWYPASKSESIPYLVKDHPFAAEAWKKWQAAAKPDYSGQWKVIGHNPGRGGNYTGRLTVRALGDDRYEGEFTHDFADGSQVSGKTMALVYTGFQWRGVAQLDGGKRHKEIFFASEDGTVLAGRRLLTDLGDLGMDETLYRRQNGARLLTVTPAAVKIGETQKVKLFGMNFPANLSAAAVAFGAGVTVQSFNQSGDDTVVAEVVVDHAASEGPRQAMVQGVQGKIPFYVYRAVDYIRLAPERGFARPGGVHAPKISQQFEVTAYLNGKDGIKGTDDDVKVGRVSPTKWNLEEYVKRMNDDDVQFVGAVDQDGLFTPAADGPNPQRHMLEHNVGDVWVEAWYQPDGAKRPMGARAFLLVMPERFNFQPIE